MTQKNRGSEIQKDTKVTKGNAVIHVENVEEVAHIPVTDHHENTRLEFGDEIRKMIHTSGTLKLTEAENKKLTAPFPDKDVYIKPDGLIYLSWFNFSNRLNSVFGIGGWILVAEGMPKVFNDLVVWGFHLVIRGIYCGTAIGEQMYFNNGRMTYGEACEGAKSNALMRLCKALGIGLQLWDEVFINNWLDNYATFTWQDDPKRVGKKKKVWSLKPNAFGKEEKKPEVKNHQKTNPPENPDVTSRNAAKTTASNTTSGEVKNNGMSENKDFLTQNTGTQNTTKKPLKPANQNTGKKEETLEPSQVKTNKFKEQLESCTTSIDLKNSYNLVKIAWNAGEISVEQKESLRALANTLAAKLVKQ